MVGELRYTLRIHSQSGFYSNRAFIAATKSIIHCSEDGLEPFNLRKSQLGLRVKGGR